MGKFFLEIVNMSITASYLIAAVIVLRLVLTKAPKWIRGILWALVGIRLVVPFSFESIFSLMPDKSPISTGTVQSTASGTDVGVPPAMLDFSTSAGAAPQSTEVTGEFAPMEETLQTASVSLPDILAIVWMAGMIAMLAYCIISYIRLNKRMADAVIYNRGLCADDCKEDVSQKRGKKYSIYQSEKVVSPFVLGLFRPRIYVPFQMTAKDMECVIAHEKAHIARKDHWIKPIAFLLLSFYWFNPLVWVAYILLCRDIELACDEKVIREMGENHKKAYSEALLKCSAPGRVISACPLAFGEVGVKKRIVNVLNYKKPAFWVILVSLFVCVVVAVCFMTKPKEKTIPYINDGSVEWENVSEIILYSDGYYGRTLEEPLVITDEEILREIIEATLDVNEYREVNDGEALEGLGVIFIDYQNGAVLSMYNEPNYGMISDTMQTSGATCYYVPKELHDTVIGLFKEAHDREILLQTGQLPYSGAENVFEPEQILTVPPTLTMQDALSSAMNFTYVESGTYEWNYPKGNADEMINVSASGLFPTIAVKGKEDEWIEVRDYNGIDYAPYMLSWGIEPDRIRVVEYDLLELGDMEPQVLSEQQLEEVYFLELRPRRIYEVVAEWDKESDENGFYGEATYIFATDNYAVTSPENGDAMAGMNLPAVADTPWEQEVNTLDGVSLSMEKYSDTNGELEINNQLRLNLRSSNDVGKILQTGAWFTIQREINGAWYDLEPIAQVAWEEIAYKISAGETTVLPVKWEYLYGELPPGEYRIVISIQDWRAPGDFDTYYLADEFRLNY